MERGALAMPKGPVPISKVSKGGCGQNTDDLGGKRLIEKRSFATCKSKRIKKRQVDDVGTQANDSKLSKFMAEFFDQFGCRHPTRLAVY